MNLISKPLYKELPLVEGKVYPTKFATGDLFQVVKIKKIFFKSGDYQVERVVGIEGYYVGKEHIGLCPLSEERLVHEKEQIGTVECCPHCGKDIK